METGVYCRKCGYDLRGQVAAGDGGAGRCSECGRGFDAGDARTYLGRPRRRWVKRTVWTGGVVIVVALVVAGVCGWVYHGWKVEQDALRSAMPFDRWSIRPLGSDYLRAHLGSFGKYLDRYSEVTTGENPGMMPGDFPAIAQLHYLQKLSLCDPEVTDANVAHLAGLTELRELKLYSRGDSLSDNGLRQLSGLHHLQVLWVGSWGIRGSGLAELDLHDLREVTVGDGVDDSAIRALAGGTRIESLSLSGNITDEGLRELRNLKHLRVLSLGCAAGSRGVTDAGLEELRSLTSLRKLSLCGTATSKKGRYDLETALVGLVVDCRP